jgi:rhodanese-related sulfurtransferase
LEAFRTRHGTNAHVVVYCSSTSCSLSFKLAYKLAKDYGFTQTQYMTGGYFEYQRDAGLAGTNPPPVATAGAANTPPANPAGAPGTPPVQVAYPVPGSVSQLNPQPMSWAKVEEWIAQRQALLVDTRSAEAFQAGHVPGALSLPSGSTPEKIAAFRQDYGTNRAVIVYGDAAGSMRAFVAGRQLMREAGFSSVRFVTEGYKEWQAKQATSAQQ